MKPDEISKGEQDRIDKADANYKTLADVSWSDLQFFLEKARRTKDPASFDTAIRVLTAIKRQVTGK